MFISSATWPIGLVVSADQLQDRLAQAVLGRAGRRLALDAEDAGHDHVERDRLHARRERERLADRPASRSRARRPRRSSACSARSPRRGTAAAAACAGACGAAPTAVSTEFGPTIGRSGDSPVSRGRQLGLAVNSDLTWSGWLTKYVRSSAFLRSIGKRTANVSPSSRRVLNSSGTWRTLKRRAVEPARKLERGRQVERRAVVGCGAGGGRRGLADQARPSGGVGLIVAVIGRLNQGQTRCATVRAELCGISQSDRETAHPPRRGPA